MANYLVSKKLDMILEFLSTLNQKAGVNKSPRYAPETQVKTVKES